MAWLRKTLMKRNQNTPGCTALVKNFSSSNSAEEKGM